MRRIIALIMGLALLPVMAMAATIHVPAVQPTIQAGINAAANGDTVLVAAGTYLGDGNRDIDYGGRLIVVKSESGPENTRIDCRADSLDPHYAFYFHTQEDSSAILDGFAVAGAYFGYRGAVSCSSAAPTIRNCVISDNLSCGISLYNGFGMVVENCQIRKNMQDGVNLSFCRALITNCVIDSNHYCGISATNNTTLDLSRCLVYGNGSYGTLVCVFATKFHIVNCTFAANQTGFWYDGDFAKSSALSSSQSGLDTSRIANCIFANNRDYGFRLGYFAGYFQAFCNDWFGNNVANFYSQSSSPFDTMANISANPLFCNIYEIAVESPCAPANNSCQALMGCYPVSCSITPICGDVNSDGSIDVADPVYLLRYVFAGGPPPIPLLAGDVNCDYGINIADIVYLILYIFSGGSAPCAGCN